MSQNVLLPIGPDMALTGQSSFIHPIHLLSLHKLSTHTTLFISVFMMEIVCCSKISATQPTPVWHEHPKAGSTLTMHG
jgi:hypothetical protein